MSEPNSTTSVAPTEAVTVSDHAPLSRKLRELLHAEEAGAHFTLNQIFDRTEGRGLFLVLILLCLPFVTPVSLPGISNVLGGVMMVLGIRHALGLAPHLPRRIGNRPLPNRFHGVLSASTKVLERLERWVRPRRTAWMGWPAARFANGSLLAFLAMLLALPIPPIIPLSNMLPAYAIILLALSMMEEDGSLVWVAYAAAGATTGYFFFWSGAIVRLTLKYYEPVLEWLGNAL